METFIGGWLRRGLKEQYFERSELNKLCRTARRTAWKHAWLKTIPPSIWNTFDSSWQAFQPRRNCFNEFRYFLYRVIFTTHVFVCLVSATKTGQVNSISAKNTERFDLTEFTRYAFKNITSLPFSSSLFPLLRLLAIIQSEVFYFVCIGLLEESRAYKFSRRVASILETHS